MIRVGLVGFGMAGRVFHAPLISSVDGLELAAVVERNSNQASARYRGITTYRALEEMLANDSLSLIVVATPSGSHFEIARQVLAAGKNAVVDKPLATDSDQIAELIALSKPHGPLLMPFQNRRWDGDFLTIQQILRDGTLGRLVHLESRMDRWSPGATRRPWKEDPEQGGGVLLDLGTHLVDQALMLFGKPLAVSADVLRERDRQGANDAFSMRLRYEDFSVTLGANALSSPPGARFHLRGTKGNFLKKGVDPQEAALNKITRITAANWGSEPSSDWGILHVDVDGAIVTQPLATQAGDYRRYYMAVRDALLGKSALPTTATEAWRTARILEWAQESSNQRHEIVCAWSEESA